MPTFQLSTVFKYVGTLTHADLFYYVNLRIPFKVRYNFTLSGRQQNQGKHIHL